MAVNDSTNEVTVRRLYGVLNNLWDKISTALGGKADKVTEATTGNLASFDANGNIEDSGQAKANLVHDASYVHTDNNYTSEEKTKLSGVATGAQVNVIETIKRNGSALTVTNKAVDISVPTPSSTATDIKMNGTQSAGSSDKYARADHVHPTDTSREKAANRETSSLTTNSTSKYPSSKVVADFVNSSVATATANFLGTYDVVSDLGLTTSATNAQIATALGSHTWPSGVTPTNNDYVFVTVDDPGTTTTSAEYRRFKYNGSAWAYEYTLNNSSFTAAQWTAINSGISSTLVTNYSNHVSNTSNPHGVTKAQVGLGNVDNTSDANKPVSTAQQTALDGKQDKPSSATENNIATFNASKSTKDSGKSFLASSSTWDGTSDNKIPTAKSVQAKLDEKLGTSGNGSNVTVTFSAASSKTDVSSGSTLATLFGVLKKWYASFGSLAWRSNVTDSYISGTISDSHIASASTWNAKQDALTEMTTTEVTDMITALGDL